MDRDDEFICILEAERRFKIHRRVLSRRIDDGRLDAYADPSDDRKKLLRVADVERLLVPRPLNASTTGAERVAVAS